MFPNFALFLLLNFSNQVLLLRRINTPFCNGCYSLPGGKIELGETAREAVIREAKNSLSIDLKLNDLEFKHIMYRKCNEPEFFSCVFSVMSYDQQPINGELERHDKLEWFDLDALPDNMVPAHKLMIERVQKKFLYSEDGFERGSCAGVVGQSTVDQKSK